MLLTGIVIRVNLQEGYSELINQFLQDDDFDCVFAIRHKVKTMTIPTYISLSLPNYLFLLLELDLKKASIPRVTNNIV